MAKKITPANVSEATPASVSPSTPVPAVSTAVSSISSHTTPVPAASTSGSSQVSGGSAVATKLNGFEQALKTYLDAYAANDPGFAAKYTAGKKTIQGCAKYIMDDARKNFMLGGNVACMDDATGYGMAVHYFDEDSIEEFTGKVNGKAMTSSQAAQVTTKMAANPDKAAKAKQKTAERKTKQKPVTTPVSPGVQAMVDNISDIFAYAESDQELELF